MNAANGTTPPRRGQTLLIDADDTLWENNIYFEQAIAAFFTYLNHEQHTAAELRNMLNDCERETVRQYGYGLRSFQRSLLSCYERVSYHPLTEVQRARVADFAKLISDQEIELLAGVADTLPQLAARHRLILVTKGHAEEQQDKLARSGMGLHFSAVEIPAEKHAEAYRDIAQRYSLDPGATWMIGNSPKSDINPALAAGLHAVLVRHPNTWVLEHEELKAPSGPQQFIEVRSFRELIEYF